MLTRTAAGPVGRVAEGTAHPHARRPAQPGFAAQAQAGLSPVPVHREAAARIAGRWRAGHAGRPWRGQVVPGLHHLRPVLSCSAAAGRSMASRRGPIWSRSRARLPSALGFDRMSFLNLTVAESAQRGGLAGADRRGDRAARLRHRDRRRDRFRPGEAGALHGAGALLPGRDCGLPAPDQGAGAVAHAIGGAVAPSAAHARNRQPAHQRAALPATSKPMATRSP